MSTGLSVFDTTLQETNAWLKVVETHLGPCGRQEAYGALRAVLHVLRDRLPQEAVLRLSAQLPMLLRGVFLEGWRPAEGPSNIHTLQAFADEVANRLPRDFRRPPYDVMVAAFAAMGGRLDPGEMRKLMGFLPHPLRAAWPLERKTN